MKKFNFLKPKQIFYLDSFLKKRTSKHYNFIVISIPLLPCTTEVVNLAGVDYLEKYYPGHGINIIFQSIENNGSRGVWLLNETDYINKGAKIIKNKSLIARVEKDFKSRLKTFNRCVSKLEKFGIRRQELAVNYMKFLEIYMSVFATAYCITGPITNGGYSDILTEKLLNKYHYSKNIKDAIGIFTRPKQNFLFDEEKSLRKIAFKIREHTIKSLSELKKYAPRVYWALEQHQRKYYWIENNYTYTKCLGINYFFEKAKKIISEQKLTQESLIRVKNKYSFQDISKKDIILLKKLGDFAAMHDQRKRANLITNYWLSEFLKKIAQETKTPYSLLKFMSFSETQDLLGGKKIDKNKISARKNKCFIINIKGGREYLLTGSDYDNFQKLIFKEKRIQKSSIIKGMAANPGVVSGRVRIIFDVKNEGKKFRKGEILVVSMTRPEFILLARQASAIITDEGGITSHAAIISRELGIPCVIGTKIATKVLKDGDLVEVDADKGIIKILKKSL